MCRASGNRAMMTIVFQLFRHSQSSDDTNVICKNRFLEYSIGVSGAGNRVADSSTVKGLTRFGSTQRRDAWWIENLPFIIVISAFGIYTTWRAFEGKFYCCGWTPYLSPFYSPLIDPQHHWWPFSPAILILGGPLGFRTTCYYYRKAILPRHSCWTRRRARSARAAAASIAARRRFRSSCRMCTAISSTSR